MTRLKHTLFRLASFTMLAASMPACAQQMNAADTATSSSVSSSAEGRTNTLTDAGRTPGDWSSESRYWEEKYSSRPYYSEGKDYTSYEPAYRYGYESFSRYSGQPYGALDQEQLRSDWERAHDNQPGLSWNDAQGPMKDAYERRYESYTRTETR